MSLKVIGEDKEYWEWFLEMLHTPPVYPSAKSKIFKSDLYDVEVFDNNKMLLGYITLEESVVTDYEITEIIKGETALPDMKSNRLDTERDRILCRQAFRQ